MSVKNMTDEDIEKWINNSRDELINAEYSGSDENKIAHATVSIAISNLVIASMMVREENRRNCKP